MQDLEECPPDYFVGQEPVLVYLRRDIGHCSIDVRREEDIGSAFRQCPVLFLAFLKGSFQIEPGCYIQYNSPKPDDLTLFPDERSVNDCLHHASVEAL